MDLNLIPSFIAFCATAPRVRRNFFAACVAESLAFARLRKLLTSSFDHADTLLRFLLAIDPPARKKHLSYLWASTNGKPHDNPVHRDTVC
jgi:hypothetical protein